MTAPKIVRSGAFRAAGREVDVVGLDGLCIALVATSDETEDARALAEARQVRVTIEPVDASPPAHGSPLDYLAELRGILTGLCMTHASDSADQTSRALHRAISLANTVSLAIAAERKGRT